MIKGINKDISVEYAQKAIRDVFSLRFGPKNIIKIQLYRPIGNIQQLSKKRKNLKKKLKKYNKYKK